MKRPLAIAAITSLIAGTVIAATAPSASAAQPQVFPQPQTIAYSGAAIDLSGKVTVVADADVDGPAKRELTEVLAAAGAEVTWAASAPSSGTAIYFSVTDTETEGIAEQLLVESAKTLDSEGYVVANGTADGRPTVLLEGASDRGLYYAVDTFGELVEGSTMAAAKIRDWPLMPIRGSIEGFYGVPWSHEARLDQLEFYGEHKMNTYVYTPKDDPYLRTQWRNLYPAAELADLKELVDEAKDNHVEFVFALSPGNDVCYSLDSDHDATLAKFEQLRQIGVKSFYIALDDIDPYLKCQQDLQRFTLAGFRKLAEGQAFYLNRIVDEFIVPNGLNPLQTVPTNYSGSQPDAYKDQFGTSVDDSVIFQWTGEGVFSDSITMESVARALTTYNTDKLYIWDNFPVNDGQPDRLFLNPLDRRAPNLYQHIMGFTSNPMVQSYASMIALAGYADYSWNGPDYDPQATQARILDELAGDEPGVREALEVFVDLNLDWRPYRPSSVQAPALGADIAEFWTAYAAGDDAGMEPLQQRLATIIDLPETLDSMAEPGFYADSLPWIEAASEWAGAVQLAIDGLNAVADGDRAGAAADLLASRDLRESASTNKRVSGLENPTGNPQRWVPKVGDTRFDSFLTRAYTSYLEEIGAEAVSAQALPATASVSANLGQYQANAPSRMVDGNLSTLWWSNKAPSVGDWAAVDLGAVVPIGGIAVHQGDNDTTRGDMFYNAELEFSADGQSWSSLGRFTDAPLVQASAPEGAKARYVRIRAVGTNAGNNWIKIREFVVTSPDVAISTTIEGASIGSAFDASLLTDMVGVAVTGDTVTRSLGEVQNETTVRLLGNVKGEVQALLDNEWTKVGDATGTWFEGKLRGPVTAVRVVLAAGEVELTEMVVLPVIASDPTPSPTPTPEPSVTPTPEPSVTPTPEPSVTPTPEPSKTPTTEPSKTPGWEPSAPYTLPGMHQINGRTWNTTCEPYSQTSRCRTDIWATVVVKGASGFEVRQGWAFNNLTYLPYLTRGQWKGNPLGATGNWSAADGRAWMTECDTAATGRGACRSYTRTTVYAATAKKGGGYTFGQSDKWVFNNLVLFKQ